MLHFFTLLTGDRYALLKQQGPASRKKVIAMGTGLVLVTGLWLFTGYNLGTTALGLQNGQAIAMGLILAGFVFLLDRMILLGGERPGAIGSLRIALAFCMALVGGAGIDTCLLKSEIDQTLVSVHQERMEERIEQVSDGHAKVLNAAEALVFSARSAKQVAEEEWMAEINGSLRGTGRYGNGAVARAKEGLVNIRIAELAQAESRFAKMKAREVAEITIARNELSQAQDVPALFDRLHAMHRYVQKDGLVLFGYLLVTFILILFELAPLMAKWGMGITAYELEVRLVDEMQREKATTQHAQLLAHHGWLRKMTDEQRQAMLVMQQAHATYVRGHEVPLELKRA